MNRKQIVEEVVFQERIREEDMFAPLTSLWGDVSLLDSIAQRDSLPLLGLCRNCLKTCKKHNAPGLFNFRCFDRKV